jgi:N-acetylglucosamine-6-sulfatase
VSKVELSRALFGQRRQQGTWSGKRKLLLVSGALAALVAAVVTLAVVFGPGEEGGTTSTSVPGSGGKGHTTAPARKSANGRPNIVVVLTDDQDAASMRVMTNVQRLLERKGTTFRRHYASYPLCCPFRATLLTGQYAHNHGVLENTAPTGGYYKLDHSNTLPIWLQKAGYYTGHVGKYLNEYGKRNPREIPPGWSEWYAAYGAQYFGFRLNENGNIVQYGKDDYETDVLGRKAVDFIRKRAPSRSPFLLNFWPNAPHDAGAPNQQGRCGSSAKPAPRHSGRFEGEALPKPPSFGEADISDKPAGIRNLRRLTDADIADITRRYRCRLESLLSVDEAVRDILVALNESGELDNTLIIYASDNGFMLGEHRVRSGKILPYEESIRVPLLMRGPGVPHHKSVRDVVANVDLAPTILDAANASAGLRMDGRSLFRLMKDPGDRLGRAIVIETAVPKPVNTYKGAVTQRYMYAEYASGDKELYDLAHDPFELQNVQGQASYGRARAALAGDVARMRNCSGAACRERPRSSLRLGYRAGRVNGRRCVRGALSASVAGSQSSIERVEFSVGGHRVATDSKRPFRRSIRGRLKRGRSSTVGALLEMVDGRELTVDRKARGCGRR